MERYEMDTVCRLCLSKNTNLIYVFESKGILGWTAADGILEFLRIQVSADDIYPQCVCIDCMGKLEDFKEFKERCESNKELLERAYTRKRGIEHDEMESDLRPPCTICEVYSLIPNKYEMELPEEEERDTSGNLGDVKPSVSHLNGAFTEVKEEPRGEGSIHESVTRSSAVCAGSDNGNLSRISEWEVTPNNPTSETVDLEFTVDGDTKIECDLSSLCTVAGSESRIPNDDQMELHQEEESETLDGLTDKKPSVSEVIGAFTGVKEEPREEGSDHECSGDVVTLRKMERIDGVPQVKQGCSNGSVSEISTAVFRNPDKELISSDRDHCRLHSTLPHLQQPRINDEFSTLPAEPPRHVNMGSKKHLTDNNDSSRSSCIPSHANNPQVLSSVTTTFERGERVRGCHISSRLGSPKEVDCVQQKCSEEVSSCAEADVVEKHKRSPSMRVLRPQTHERNNFGSNMRDNIDNGGCLEMERRKKWRLQNNFDEVYCKLKCSYCGISFAAKRYLRKHIESHILEMMSKSVVHLANKLVGRKRLVDVNEGIDGRSVMDVKSVRSSKEWVCKVCKNKFRDSRSLRMHQRIHSGDTLFKCAECEKTFSEKSTLREHLTVHNRKGSFLCTLCPKRYSHKKTLQTHLKIHSGVEVNKCEFCGKEFSLISNLKIHQRIHRGEKPFKCKHCDKRFSRGSTLNTHLMVHTEGRPFECGVCNKRFRWSSRLKLHKRIHTEKKPYECGVCNKRFRSSSNLKTHKRIHTGNKPYECRVCNKQFGRSSNLKTHKRIHTGEKPYGCEVCNKQFREVGSLKKHIRTHTKEKPFECGICHKKFSESSNINVHLRIHTGEKPFECGTCSKQFNQASNLKKHLRTHTALKLFQC